MARIRTIKPELWQDEKLAPLPAIARLVFLALISMADDDGRLVDNIKLIDGFVFSETDESSRESIESLARLGRVLRYRSKSGQRLLQIANWAKHQRVDNPAKYTLPAPTPEDYAAQGFTTATPTSEGDPIESLARVSRSDLLPVPTTNDLLPTTPDPTTAQSTEAVGATDAVVRLVVAANSGIAKHTDPKRRQIDPINANSIASKDATGKILAAGVPVEFAEAAITRIARVCEPNGRVNSLRYFTAAVIREWEERDGPVAKRPRSASRFAPASDTTKAIIADMVAGKA